MKKLGIKALIANLIAVVISASMLVGTTFAWFTDTTTSSNNIIASGLLDVNAYWKEGKLDPTTSNDWIEFDDGAIFNSDKWEPGYVQARHIKVANEGTLAFKYKLLIVPNGNVSALADVIDVYYLPTATQLSRSNITNATPVATLAELIADPDGAAYGVLLPEGATPNNAFEQVGSTTVTIVLKMQENISNDYQNLSIGTDFDVVLYATQYSYEEDSFGNDYDAGAQYPTTTDSWDGTSSIDWFLENPEATTFSLSTAEDLKGLADLVDGSATIPADAEITLPTTFDGKTFQLEADIDLLTIGENNEPVCFEPIGGYRSEQTFTGIFDGQGHTISNLTQTTWALNNGYAYSGDLGLGLFGCIENATIKNLTVDGANISGESALCGTIAATAFGDCTFENITVKNANVADYQYYAGGIVGWASGNHLYKNCVIDESTNIAAQWGDFDNSIGGVIGGASGSATIKLEDCIIACRIDAYNDVTSSYQWYAYRRAGMIIGNSSKTETIGDRTVASAPQLTCENVTVIYGDWANYTYCAFAGTSWPYVRVQEGVSNSGYSNPRYGHPTDANGNQVIDDNHVHNDGEDHHKLLAFDQLYGGGQGVYGQPEHAGVKVIYNNK